MRRGAVRRQAQGVNIPRSVSITRHLLHRNQALQIFHAFDLEPDSEVEANVVCYGQVRSYIHVTLPAEPRLKTNQIRLQFSRWLGYAR